MNSFMHLFYADFVNLSNLINLSSLHNHFFKSSYKFLTETLFPFFITKELYLIKNQ